ncbi:PTS lactose transporter subunit IIB [Staphylococcus microti]|uniref:BglG family transcriptional antiterminator n=1 Tax=Staphylococcus microti TaxID=569857 RepID=A0A0D6XPQ9_9STAP|nr:BglG family transcription antiterminator [Staphylococcus microti]KIX89833.1 PTS lactose transporter subunit IIB [Staphylococcus microti]PNZ80044.1 PRD domain-containing protein [Staphylococcus microti]SUM58096.1 BglG family transcriptional antiterminator [Staphylococcus microti]
MYMGMRERQILLILLKNKGYPINLFDIAQQIAVSSRTVHRELKNIDTTLATFHMTLRRIKNKGILLEGDESAFEALTQAVNALEVVDLTSDEQKVIVLYALIQSGEPVKQMSLASEIGASLQQLSKVLDHLALDLAQFHIKLIRKRGEGISIVGSEMQKRALLSQLMMERLNSTSVYSVIENHFVFQTLNQERLPMVDMKDIFQVERLLMDDLDQLPYTLTESSYLALIVHIVLSIERMKHQQFVSVEQNIIAEVQDTLEFQIATHIAQRLGHHYDVTFNQSEITFMTIHLRGAKRRNDKDTPNQESYHALVNALIDDVAAQTDAQFESRSELEAGLLLHLPPAINRIRANIKTYNPMTQRILSSYPTLYDAVAQSIAKALPSLSFPDYEIAFLVLHFGGAIVKNKQLTKVLVVCSSGIGTSRILANRLTEAFPMIDEIEQAAVSTLKTYDLSKYDAIISTIELDIHEPYLTVSPLLPEHELTQTTHFLQEQLATKLNQQQRTIMQADVNTTDTHAAIPKDDINQKLALINACLSLADDIIVSTAHCQNLDTALAHYLAELKVINNTLEVSHLLKQRNQTQNFSLAPYPVAIPHLKDKLIVKPHFSISKLAQPITSPDQPPIHYVVCAMLPENSQLTPLVSHLYSYITEHLEDIDTWMSDQTEVEHALKQQILTFIKHTL